MTSLDDESSSARQREHLTAVGWCQSTPRTTNYEIVQRKTRNVSRYHADRVILIKGQLWKRSSSFLETLKWDKLEVKRTWQKTVMLINFFND